MKKGRFWIGTGSLLIAAALGLTGYNLYVSERAGNASERALAALAAQIEGFSLEPEVISSSAAASEPAGETVPAGNTDPHETRAVPQETEASSPVQPESLPEESAETRSPVREEIPDFELVPAMAMPEQLVDGVAYIGVLSMPTIDRYLPICSSCDNDRLLLAPCRYSGTVYLDNMTICAHNISRHFSPIPNLKLGDLLYFTDVDGNRFYYRVAEIEILQPTAIEAMTESSWDLTLFTCTLGGRTRFTVRCSLADP